MKTATAWMSPNRSLPKISKATEAFSIQSNSGSHRFSSGAQTHQGAAGRAAMVLPSSHPHQFTSIACAPSPAIRYTSAQGNAPR